jgi:ParB-like chromosome segregation protein Spo0J
MSRAIEFVPLDDLVFDPRNPKNHDVGLIDASIGRFGVIDPVVRDERTGYLISGHGRTETLRAMHARGESAPEGVQVAESGGWLIPVAVGWASRTDTEAMAALVALNRTTEAGGWEETALLDLLEQVTAAGGDDALLGVGYDEAAIEGLRQYLNGLDEVEGFLGAADPEALAAAHAEREAGEAEGDGGRAADDALSVQPDARVLHVQVPADLYQEAYAALSEMPWVLDVRDAKVQM